MYSLPIENLEREASPKPRARADELPIALQALGPLGG
jgi:hypothetical protein